jgi:hypothetical protein
MEDRRKTPERCVRQCFEGHRLEEQLLAMAYEQIQPVIRQRPRWPAATPSHPCYHTTPLRTQEARSA